MSKVRTLPQDRSHWGRGKGAVALFIPAGAVVMAASVAWACVSHTGLGAMEHRVLNQRTKQVGDSQGCLADTNPIGAGGTCLAPTQAVEVNDGDTIISEVDHITADPANLTFTYKIRFSTSCWSTSPEVWPLTNTATPGPVFTAKWTVPDVAENNVSPVVYYRACVESGTGMLTEEVVFVSA